MHRIDTPNRSINLWGAGKDGWRDGNKVGGINPTEFNAAFQNTIQEELAAIAETAGLVLDPANNTQLLMALRSAGLFQTPVQFDNSNHVATTTFVRNELLGLGNAAYSAIFGASLASNGYQKLPSGLIIQWGMNVVTAGAATAVTMPLAFPTTYHALGAIDSVLLTATQFATVTRTSNSVLSLYINSGTSVNVHWIAIGY